MYETISCSIQKHTRLYMTLLFHLLLWHYPQCNLAQFDLYTITEEIKIITFAFNLIN